MEPNNTIETEFNSKTTVYTDGRKKVVDTFKDGYGRITEYNSSGIVTRLYSVNSKGQKSGVDYSFFPDGKLQEEIFYNEDIPDGRFVTYYKSGKVKLQGHYSKGKVEEITEYFENRQVNPNRGLACLNDEKMWLEMFIDSHNALVNGDDDEIWEKNYGLSDDE